jgi:Macrocin-O-methyltransferase (TylF)
MKQALDLLKKCLTGSILAGLLAGWFADFLLRAAIEQVELLHIDGHVYRSTMEVLNALP